MFRLHVSLGLPLFRRPSGFQYRHCYGVHFSSIRSVCPNISTFFCSAKTIMVLVQLSFKAHRHIRSGHLMHLCKRLFMITWILLIIFSVSIHITSSTLKMTLEWLPFCLKRIQVVCIFWLTFRLSQKKINRLLTYYIFKTIFSPHFCDYVRNASESTEVWRYINLSIIIMMHS